jgi:hypothetical protein
MVEREENAPTGDPLKALAKAMDIEPSTLLVKLYPAQATVLMLPIFTEPSHYPRSRSWPHLR